jgi:hypothetical protein
LDVEHADVDALLLVAEVRREGGELFGVDETVLFLEEGARGYRRNPTRRERKFAGRSRRL